LANSTGPMNVFCCADAACISAGVTGGVPGELFSVGCNAFL
jgi:hypothetical protein